MKTQLGEWSKCLVHRGQFPTRLRHDRPHKSLLCDSHHGLGWELIGSGHLCGKSPLHKKMWSNGHRGIVCKYSLGERQRHQCLYDQLHQQPCDILYRVRLWMPDPHIHQSGGSTTKRTSDQPHLSLHDGRHCMECFPNQLLLSLGAEGQPQIYKLHNSLAYPPSRGYSLTARDSAHMCCSSPNHPKHKYAHGGLPPTGTGLRQGRFLLDYRWIGEPRWGSPRLMGPVVTPVPPVKCPPPVGRRSALQPETPLQSD